MKKSNKLHYILCFFLSSLLVHDYAFAQSQTGSIDEVLNRKRHTWVFEMIEMAQSYERNDSNIYKIDKYYDNCIQKKAKTLANCETCAQYSLAKWNYFADSLFNKAYKLSSKNYKYQNLMLEMQSNWLEFRVASKAQRILLASKIKLTPKNYILLYYQEIVMAHRYAKFLETLSH
jgi:hypothetical protein